MHKWIKKDHIAVHVYRWACEECGLESFNISGDEPTHFGKREETHFGTYTDVNTIICSIEEANEISCAEYAIESIIT